MRYRETLPLNRLIKKALGPHARTQKSLDAALMHIWYDMLPHTKNNLRYSAIKSGRLYIQPSSTLLRHQLHLQKSNVLKKMKKKLRKQDLNPDLLQDIILI